MHTAWERVFGSSRLKMVTGPYVEVYREATPSGARRRYTKRFIATEDGDFRAWTEREWRILARLVGHGARHVPDVVQYDRGSAGGHPLVQTYDAGVTVDHWLTLLPVQRDGQAQQHVFQDCAHWWALAKHLLLALHEIHALKLVHLDLKADNICLPYAPPSFHPTDAPERIYPVFEHIALIDFAFSLISGEALTTPLPIGWQKRFRYQSPRLLHALAAGRDGNLEPTRQLDWRCDMFSLEALLNGCLPGVNTPPGLLRARGWTDAHLGAAERLLGQIRACHDAEAGNELPHPALVDLCTARLQSSALDASLALGWSLAVDGQPAAAMAPTVPLTPVTLIEPCPSAGVGVTEIHVRRENGTHDDLRADEHADPHAESHAGLPAARRFDAQADPHAVAPAETTAPPTADLADLADHAGKASAAVFDALSARPGEDLQVRTVVALPTEPQPVEQVAPTASTAATASTASTAPTEPESRAPAAPVAPADAVAPVPPGVLGAAVRPRAGRSAVLVGVLCSVLLAGWALWFRTPGDAVHTVAQTTPPAAGAANTAGGTAGVVAVSGAPPAARPAAPVPAASAPLQQRPPVADLPPATPRDNDVAAAVPGPSQRDQGAHAQRADTIVAQVLP